MEMESKKDRAITFIMDKRDEVKYKMRWYADMEDKEAAQSLRLAAESLDACVRYLVGVPVA